MFCSAFKVQALIPYRFTGAHASFVLILSQLQRRQIGVKKVVKIIKNRLIPSIPKEKWRFQLDDHSISVKNWYWFGDKSFRKNTHKKHEDRKVINDVAKATSFTCCTLFIKKQNKQPINGVPITKRSNQDVIFLPSWSW